MTRWPFDDRSVPPVEAEGSPPFLFLDRDGVINFATK